MVVCRFYLEGRCKYGDRCHNEHPADLGFEEEPEYNSYGPPSRGQYHSTGNSYRPRYQSAPQRYPSSRGTSWEPRGPRGGYSNRFTSPSYQSPTPRYESPNNFSPAAQIPQITTDAEILEDIKKDMEHLWHQNPSSTFQQGRIWPFTCYTYVSADGTIKTDELFGLSDYSMEELRVAAYEARTDQAALTAHAQQVGAQGNAVRLMCTNIYNASLNPHSDGARNVITEIRSKAAQHAARLRMQTDSAQASPFQGYQTPVQTHAYSPAQMGFSATSEPPSMAVTQPGAMPGTPPQSISSARGVYSDTTMLTPDDFLQFASPEFTQGKVPFRPPSKNFC